MCAICLIFEARTWIQLDKIYPTGPEHCQSLGCLASIAKIKCEPGVTSLNPYTSSQARISDSDHSFFPLMVGVGNRNRRRGVSPVLCLHSSSFTFRDNEIIEINETAKSAFKTVEFSFT